MTTHEEIAAVFKSSEGPISKIEKLREMDLVGRPMDIAFLNVLFDAIKELDARCIPLPPQQP